MVDWNELKNDCDAYRRAYCDFMFDINNRENVKNVLRIADLKNLFRVDSNIVG